MLNFGIMIDQPVQSILPAAMNKMKKIEMIKRLIVLRKMHFDGDKEARSRIESEVKDGFYQQNPSFTTESRLGDLYSKRIYCLSDEVLKLDRYKSVLSNN